MKKQRKFAKDGSRLEQYRKRQAKLGRKRRELSLNDDEWQKVQQFVVDLRET